MTENKDWKTKGKSISQVIKELQTFEDRSLEVRLSLDGGETHHPVRLIGKIEGKFAALMKFEV